MHFFFQPNRREHQVSPEEEFTYYYVYSWKKQTYNAFLNKHIHLAK